MPEVPTALRNLKTRVRVVQLPVWRTLSIKDRVPRALSQAIRRQGLPVSRRRRWPAGRRVGVECEVSRRRATSTTREPAMSVAGPGRAARTRGCGLGVASGDHGSAGMSRLVLSCGEELGDRVPQLAQRRLHGAADDLGVHPVVMMGQQIPQPGDL